MLFASSEAAGQGGSVVGVRVASGPQVKVGIEGCPELDRAEIIRIFRMEMHVPAVDARPDAQAVTSASIICGTGGTVQLRVDDTITGKTLSRTVDAVPSTEATPRLLALALVELVYATWSELVLSPGPAVMPVAPPAEREAAKAATDAVKNRMGIGERSWELRISAVGAAQFMFRGTGGLYGAGLRFSGDHKYHLGWTADVLYFHGSIDVTSGSVATNMLSFSAAATARYELSIVELRAGLGVRGGAVWLTGNPGDPLTVEGRTVTGGFLGPLLFAGVDVRLPRKVSLDLKVEGGWTLVPVKGFDSGSSSVSVDGPWVGVQLGVGYSP
jgi:hypothetical protein